MLGRVEMAGLEDSTRPTSSWMWVKLAQQETMMTKTSQVAMRSAALGLLLGAIAGCRQSTNTRAEVNKGPDHSLTLPREIQVAPGESKTASILSGQLARIEGEGAGVTAVIDGRDIKVTVAKDAKEGKVEFIVTDAAGQSAPLTVNVKKSVNAITASMTLIQLVNATVERGGPEVAVKFTNGKATSISEAKDGLTARLDGESIVLTASKDAKLGGQTITIMSNEGETRLTVKVESSK